MRRIRIGIQAACAALFVFSLVLWNRSDAVYAAESEWFLRLNPLVTVLTSVASRRVIVSSALIAAAFMALTALFGRVFCGFVCPLGAVIDASDRFLFGASRHQARRPARWLQKLKYVLLCALAVAALFGIVIPWFVDPISLLTRISVLTVLPGLSAVHAWVVSTARHIAPARSWTVPARLVMQGAPGAVLLLIAVLAGGFWDRRFWCQYVCPTGAFLGILGGAARWRRRLVVANCRSCGVCAARVCPTRAISSEDPARTSSAECIVCGVCVADRRMCSAFAFERHPAAVAVPVDIPRRTLLAGAGLGALSYPFLRASRPFDAPAAVLPVRPPGALAEPEFLARCIACGECIAACPRGIIQPCTFSDGMHNLFTPKLDFRLGSCDPECRRCSFVCPTRALTPIAEGAKALFAAGTAQVNKGACLAWLGDRPCSLCKALCPYQAIETVESDHVAGVAGPRVDRTKCTGCGLCENKCPAKGIKGITVVAASRRGRTG